MKEIRTNPICINCNQEMLTVWTALLKCNICNVLIEGNFEVCPRCYNKYFVYPVNRIKSAGAYYIYDTVKLCMNPACSSYSLIKNENHKGTEFTYVIRNSDNKSIFVFEDNIIHVNNDILHLDPDSKLMEFLNLVIDNYERNKI